MNLKEQVNDWLRQYGNAKGKFFRLNSDGVFAACDEDGQEYVVDVPDDSSYVYFCAPIVVLNDAENRQQDLECALKWNLWGKDTQGGTLSFEEISQRVVFHQRYPAEHLDKDSFSQQFDHFIASVRHIQSLWKSYRQEWKPSVVEPDVNTMLRI